MVRVGVTFSFTQLASCFQCSENETKEPIRQEFAELIDCVFRWCVVCVSMVPSDCSSGTYAGRAFAQASTSTAERKGLTCVWRADVARENIRMSITIRSVLHGTEREAVGVAYP